jgi:hypothetical protein
MRASAHDSDLSEGILEYAPESSAASKTKKLTQSEGGSARGSYQSATTVWALVAPAEPKYPVRRRGSLTEILLDKSNALPY